MSDTINNLFQKYNFNYLYKEEFLNIVEPIIKHEEYQKRFDANLYPHHGKVSLGEHILSCAMVTYLLIKERIPNSDYLNIKIAVLIAVFHDFYEYPWQNSKIKKRKLVNKHGFVHPIEAVVNAITYFPEYFTNEHERRILIDGILHHMYPFPLRTIINDIDDIELNNLDKFKKLDQNLQKLIISSTNHLRVNNVSICKSIFREGKIVSKADKIVSLKKELRSLNGILACLTGNNKEL